MGKGLTRAEILKNLPKLKKGSFDLFIARAGIVHEGLRPNKKRPHMAEYIYPADSVEKIKMAMSKI